MKTKMNFRLIVLLGLIITQLSTISCSGQANDHKMANASKPDVRYKVDKKYDQNGNLIRYDSTYSYSSSSGTVNDSLLNSFINDFRMPLHNLYSDKSNFFQDSIFKINPFFEEDRFFKHFEKENQLFEQMERDIKRMEQLMQPSRRPEDKLVPKKTI